MTACPIDARIAAAASGEDLAVIVHARDCLRCRALLQQQRELISAVRSLAPSPLAPERRAALAAEVMARGDALDVAPRWRGDRVMIAATIVAAAATLALVVASRRAPVRAPAAPALTSIDEPALDYTRREHEAPVAAPQRADIVATGADFARVLDGGRDVVRLRDGEVSVDATAREPVTIVVGDTRVRIASSRAKVVARRGVIVTTHVFAGTAQIASRGKFQVIEAGDVWMRESEVEARPSAASDSLAAFRTGWEELRAHHNPQAIAAFDRATDPVVAEDAAFWAAIATERAGDLDGAATRLRAFLDRFPGSTRADDARDALVRVTK
jgi:TolA-binding protein